MRAALLAAALLLLASVPLASACTVQPPTVCHDAGNAAEVCVQQSCPPNPGFVAVRVLGHEVRVPLPP
jgi:hypothetical protein